jgi:hypothetical protein
VLLDIKLILRIPSHYNVQQFGVFLNRRRKQGAGIL